MSTSMKEEHLAKIANVGQVIDAIRERLRPNGTLPQRDAEELALLYNRTPRSVIRLASTARSRGKLPLLSPGGELRERIAGYLGPDGMLQHGQARQLAEKLGLTVRSVRQTVYRMRQHGGMPPVTRPIPDRLCRDLNALFRSLDRRYDADRGSLSLIASLESALREWRQVTGHSYWTNGLVRYRLDGAGELVRERITRPAMRLESAS